MSSPALSFAAAQNALRKREVQNALTGFFAAENSGYDAAACAGGRWYCWMLLGDFEQAWKESDWISRHARDPGALWDGLNFTGKHVMIRCLHGFGDAIQFIRYARLIAETAASVTVETHPELVRLFSDQPYLDRVVTWAEGSSKKVTNWDHQIEVMELPWAFRSTLNTLPAEVPYLRVVPRPIPHGKRKVGLVWRSSDWNRARSIPVKEFAPILEIPGLAFYSFQHGIEQHELNVMRDQGEICDTRPDSPDIADTAAALMSMDLLVTVDTMAAHLAGALGRPVWLMLPFEADWRWMLDTSVSPWYPTMTIFRQGRPGDWSGVLQAIAGRLGRYSQSQAT